MSDSLRPHKRQPTRLPHPWEYPGKSTGVGCHCLFHGNVLRDTKILFITYIISFNLHTTLWSRCMLLLSILHSQGMTLLLSHLASISVFYILLYMPITTVLSHLNLTGFFLPDYELQLDPDNAICCKNQWIGDAIN